jgi:hypothetical protein
VIEKMAWFGLAFLLPRWVSVRVTLAVRVNGRSR